MNRRHPIGIKILTKEMEMQKKCDLCSANILPGEETRLVIGFDGWTICWDCNQEFYTLIKRLE